jgi:signal transduction histidine kinase
MTDQHSRLYFGRVSRASIALVCAGFSAFVLAMCVLAGINFRNGVEEQFYRATGNIAQLLMADFDDDVAAADGILTRLAADIPPDLVSSTHESQLHQLLAGYALQPAMIGPAVLDRDGTLIASAIASPPSAISLADRNTFRIHAESANSGLYISTPIRGVITNEWAIQFSRPLRDQTGALYGVVLLSYRLSHFIDLYEKLKFSNRGLAGLTGKDGVVRIRSLNGAIGYGSSIPRMPLVYERVMKGETSGQFFGSTGPDGVTRIGSFVTSQTTPFYMTVGYDSDDLRSQYIGFFYLLATCWFVLTVAMVGLAALIRRQEKMSQRARFAAVNSAIAEREKIAADMHDSIGASLAALLAHFTTETINLPDIRRRLGEILMELRFLVDTSEADEGDINLLLGNVRHRMASGIELAGIALTWGGQKLPVIVGLTARDALAIKLALMEALSNVLHHARAKSASMTAAYDDKTHSIVIIVRDDGCGFDPANMQAGRGLANMRKRIASISTGGAITIDSAPGHGTTIRIELKAPVDQSMRLRRRAS